MWWLKEKMGGGNSRYLAELSDDSSDSDFDYSLEPRPDKKTTNFIATNPIQHLVEEEASYNLEIKSTNKGNYIASNSTQNLVEATNNLEIESSTNKVNFITTNLVQNLVEGKPSNNLEIDCSNKEMITTDASASFLKPESVLFLDKVLEIEKCLDNYEMVSLVYLLYEEPNYALQELTLFLDGASKNLLYTWANSEQTHSNLWQKKMIEALCVIKNFQVLHTLGYSKKDLKDYFLPYQSTSFTNLNKVRKVIYLICEKLNCAKTDKFLNTIKLNFQEKGLTFTEYNREYLELYFLQWETIGYISMKDMSNIKQAFKVIEEDGLWDNLESVIVPREKTEKKSEEASAPEKVPKPKRQSTSTDTHQVRPTFKSESGDFLSTSPSIAQDDGPKLGEFTSDDDVYKIDPKNPGLVLIINQEEFYTEIDPKFKHLLPEDIEKNKLESRTGTERDKIDLENTFKKFGFTVRIEENLTHEELIVKVKEAVKSVTIESSLFICILSHGDKGVVYGINSCKVKVNRIQEIMYKTNRDNLAGKPKILILQSCQGRQCQKINDYDEDDESDSMTTDGPQNSKQSVPKTGDMFTFWATVPGYAAIRHKKTGSWFIQELVKKMTELGNRVHFSDLCTMIVRDVSNQIWTVTEDEKNAMIPMVVTTLRKYFYLPPMRND